MHLALFSRPGSQTHDARHHGRFGPKGVNNCAHTLVVLVLCIFGTCRAFLLAEVFLAWCPVVKFSCAPLFVCLKGP